MTTRDPNWWRRDKDGLGVWEHRGKVAVAGVGHSPMDRRWDGKSMDTTLGAYSIIAAQKAMAEAGVSPDEIDGVIAYTRLDGAPWAPRPYFSPPYDSEDGLTMVSAEWLVKQLGLKNVKYFNSKGPVIWEEVGLAAQAVGDGLTKNCLMLYQMGNLEGRYLQGGENASDTATGNRQWTAPWGAEPGPMQYFAMMFGQYCRKYGTSPDMLAPFAVNQRRNGLMVPWGFYAQHEPYQITVKDYLDSRFVQEPVRVLDCDRPVNSLACYLFTTAERARDMKQKPVYVLNHCQGRETVRSTMATLAEHEAFADRMARRMWEGSGLSPKDLDVFNPYDGYLQHSQTELEACQWHGVKWGEAADFFAGDIRVEGPHPFLSSGGNNGTGRNRTAMYTDCIEQLRGTAGKRQIQIRCETAMAGSIPPGSGAWIMFSKDPS